MTDWQSRATYTIHPPGRGLAIQSDRYTAEADIPAYEPDRAAAEGDTPADALTNLIAAIEALAPVAKVLPTFEELCGIMALQPETASRERMTVIRPDKKGRVDDVVIDDVDCFRLERMSPKSWWLAAYRGKERVAFWLSSDAKIRISHEDSLGCTDDDGNPWVLDGDEWVAPEALSDH